MVQCSTPHTAGRSIVGVRFIAAFAAAMAHLRACRM